MVATAIGLFGITDYLAVQRMTLKEFNIRSRAYKLKKLEEERDLYLGAYLNRAVKATNKKGELIFKKFSDFYDEDKRRQEVLGKTKRPVDSNLLRIAENLKKYREEVESNGK